MVAALAWWYIELDKQNDLMLQYKTETLQNSGQYNDATAADILDEHRRNAKQYIGEGLTFFGRNFSLYSCKKTNSVSSATEKFYDGSYP